MADTQDWVPRVEAVEADVKEVKAALLGTLDGKTGMRVQVDQLVEWRKQDSAKLDALLLDRAKVIGIVLATGTIVGFAMKLLHF